MEESNDMIVDPRFDNNSSAMVPLARKRLIVQDSTVFERHAGPVIPPPGFVTDKVNLIESKSSEPVDKSLLDTSQKIQDSKRQRADPSVAAEGATQQSVTSLEEDRRAQ